MIHNERTEHLNHVFQTLIQYELIVVITVKIQQ